MSDYERDLIKNRCKKTRYGLVKDWLANYATDDAKEKYAYLKENEDLALNIQGKEDKIKLDLLHELKRSDIGISLGVYGSVMDGLSSDLLDLESLLHDILDLADDRLGGRNKCNPSKNAAFVRDYVSKYVSVLGSYLENINSSASESIDPINVIETDELREKAYREALGTQEEAYGLLDDFRTVIEYYIESSKKFDSEQESRDSTEFMKITYTLFEMELENLYGIGEHKYSIFKTPELEEDYICSKSSDNGSNSGTYIHGRGNIRATPDSNLRNKILRFLGLK